MAERGPVRGQPTAMAHWTGSTSSALAGCSRLTVRARWPEMQWRLDRRHRCHSLRAEARGRGESLGWCEAAAAVEAGFESSGEMASPRSRSEPR